MRGPAFPLYETETAARSRGCFVCLKPFGDARLEDKGYPPGRGRWAFCCRACGCWTFFDLRVADTPEV